MDCDRLWLSPAWDGGLHAEVRREKWAKSFKTPSACVWEVGQLPQRDPSGFWHCNCELGGVCFTPLLYSGFQGVRAELQALGS